MAIKHIKFYSFSSDLINRTDRIRVEKKNIYKKKRWGIKHTEDWRLWGYMFHFVKRIWYVLWDKTETKNFFTLLSLLFISFSFNHFQFFGHLIYEKQLMVRKLKLFSNTKLDSFLFFIPVFVFIRLTTTQNEYLKCD